MFLKGEGKISRKQLQLHVLSHKLQVILISLPSLLDSNTVYVGHSDWDLIKAVFN